MDVLASISLSLASFIARKNIREPPRKSVAKNFAFSVSSVPLW